MSNEIEYIEPTQEHVGQMVEVSNDKHSNYSKSKLIAIVNEDGFRFVTHGGYWPFPVGWQFARIARPLTYAERQAKCGLKVGDRVRIAKKFMNYEQGFPQTFDDSMNRYVGSIQSIDRFTEWGIRFIGIGFSWPYFVLEKVEDRVATRDDIGKQVYVDNTPSDVFTIETIYGVEGDVWRAVVRSGDKRFVYELSNLRVKE